MTTTTVNPGNIQNNNAIVPADLLSVSEFDHETIRLHGAPLGARLVIGFTEVYYTLWIATTFNRTENVRYLQNLSMDFAEAQHKANERMDSNPGRYESVEVDLDLRGESGRNFFRPLAAKRYVPELLAISSYAGTDMHSIDPNKVYKIIEPTERERRYGATTEYKKMSGLLWATYLNKDEKTIRGARRRLIARECLTRAGILVKVGREYLTPDQIKNREVKAIKESGINGHHGIDGKRLELKVRSLGKPFSFDTQYGTTDIVTLIDEENRLFKYMGNSLPEIGEDYMTIKATVKHDTYKEQAETKLQRIKIL